MERRGAGRRVSRSVVRDGVESAKVNRHPLGDGAGVTRCHRADRELFLDLAHLEAGDLGHVLIENLARVGVADHLDLADGDVRWSAEDPGLGTGGAGLALDDLLLVNAPAGRLRALDPATGEARYSLSLADPVADDVPRRLEPIVRGGALFVPAANIHVIRPHDGSAIGSALPCDLVPDWMRVDERGWVYVAEESGHVAGYAPVPHLTLIK